MTSHFITFRQPRFPAFAGLFLAGLLGLAGAAPAWGQADTLASLPRQLARYEKARVQEKLFLHLDRPVYLSGETMWFKVYAVDGTYSRPLTLSSVAYVEVLDAKNRPVLQAKIALKNAVGQGSFVVPASVASGSYTVRAYTSWMKNFAPEAYFHGPVTVLNTFVASGAAARPAKDSVAYEAQFFPEGGNLVQGLRSKVALKVTDQAGHGVAATGKVLNQKGAVVATFSTLRLGMGSFLFTPASALDTYTAVLTLGPGQTISRPLPRAFAQGYVMHLERSEPNQLTLTVDATQRLPETLFLLAHSRQQTALATRMQLMNGHAVFVFRPDQLLGGVSHFTVFNTAQQPVAERLYFQRPTPGLAVAAQADKPQYGPREKVQVQLALADADPAASASLSMAVYRLDSLAATPALAIDRYLGLTSELKGPVENPDYYFTANDAEATDNLLLTQGWSRFRWEDVLAPSLPAPRFLPEPNGPVVQARLTRAGTATPRPGVMTYLSSPSRIIRLSNAVSDADGRVQFELHHFDGPQDLVVQTDPQQDSTCQIQVLEPFSTRYRSGPDLAYGLTPRFQPDYEKRHLQTQVQNLYFGKYRNRYATERVDSLAFYGKPDETYLLDKYTRFKVLEEVLREYVPGVVVRIRKDGFHFLVADKVNQTLLAENPMVLLDGVPVFNINRIMAMPSIKIRKLEVVDSRYFQGLAVYNGVVSFSTYKGDLEGFQLDPRVLVEHYEGVQRQREFYAPRYDTPATAQSRLPDLRNLLYWNPNITTTGSQPQTLSFFTGDQAGRYLVVLQGLAADGQAASQRLVLEVKPAL
ncbi:hypothetical protein ACVWYF_001594 [Hymenobacter sp. UYAg731]